MIRFLEIDQAEKLCYWCNDESFRAERKNLIFVHGSGGDHTLWKEQLPELQEFNIAAIDLPGHGHSSGRAEQSVEEYVEWIRKFIEQSEYIKPVIIGHSLGAAISLVSAIKYGGLLSGIVPVGGGVTMPVSDVILNGLCSRTEETLAFIAKFSVTKENRGRFSSIIQKDMMKTDPAVTYGDFLSCSRLDITEQVSGIKVPALAVCGDDDKMTPPDLSRYICEGIPGAKLALIEGAGHYVMWEKPRELNSVIIGFARGLD
jgi:pimeloyl-ACP methyl ester carboxylesterase